ncbi:MAG: hypothetical protein MK132_00395 [Lentisphaerales bacterium]|nr:hypothetical protein [Lentisphaerales bacterium]
MNKIWILTFILVLCTVSCASKKDNNDLKLAPFEGDTVLIIPPLSDDSNLNNELGRSMTSNLIRKISSDVRYAGDIPKLQSALQKSNLIVDGQVNMLEVSKIGAAVNAKDVICVKVTSYTLYPPQSLSCVIISRRLDGQKYKQRVAYMNVHMEDIEDRKEFADFVGGSLRGPLGDRFIKKTDVNAEAAMLSNKQFYRFAGYKISKNILLMKKY